MLVKFDDSKSLLIKVRPQDRDYALLSQQLSAFQSGGESAMLAIARTTSPVVDIPAPEPYIDDYPRDNANRFIDKHAIVKAANDEKAYASLRDALSEDQRSKLDRAIAHLQFGGFVHSPSEEPGLGVNIDDEAADRELQLQYELDERNIERAKRRKLVEKAVKLIRKGNFEADELLKKTGATDAELRAVARAKHRAKSRGAIAELEDLFEAVIESIHCKLDAEAGADTNAALTIELEKHPHKGKGPGGGQFAKKHDVGTDVLYKGQKGYRVMEHHPDEAKGYVLQHLETGEKQRAARSSVEIEHERASDEGSGEVARKVERPSRAKADRGGGAEGESSGEGAARPVTTAEVAWNLDRHRDAFRERGEHQLANWIEKLRDHVNAIGAEAVLEALGEEAGSSTERVQYAGHSVSPMLSKRGVLADTPAEHDAAFVEAYLDRHGISLMRTKTPKGELRTVGAVAPAPAEERLGREEGGLGYHSRARGGEQDIVPTPPKFKDKLQEAKHLPGLEKSEDLGKLMDQKPGSRVEGFTPEVVSKLDKEYGKDKWIVKSYGEEAFSGYGIFFPQRVKQLHQDAKSTVHEAAMELQKHGFSYARDEGGAIVGIKHEGGDEYLFDSDKYKNTIYGDVKHWGDAASAVAEHEHRTAIPKGSFMAQPAFPVVGISNEERAQGVTFKTGQEGRVHIITRNGRTEVIPYSTWLKNEHFPVVIESEDTRAMAKAAQDAIDAFPSSAKNGQVYAPDIVRTADGYRVVEANPAEKTGSSGYLQNNPFIMDAYVSHVTGRDPAHVKFLRDLLHGKQATLGMEMCN